MDNPLYTIEENNNKNNEKEKKEQNENKDVKNINQRIEDYELNNDALIFELKELNKQYEEMKKNKNTNMSRDISRDKKSKYSIGSTMKSSISNFIKDTQSEHKLK